MSGKGGYIGTGILLILILVFSYGCPKNRPLDAPPSLQRQEPPPGTEALVQTLPEIAPPAKPAPPMDLDLDPLVEAESWVKEGDYQKAIEIYEEALAQWRKELEELEQRLAGNELKPNVTEERAQRSLLRRQIQLATFLIAVMYSSAGDPQNATEYLNQLLSEDPNGLYVPAARTLLGLYKEIEQLKESQQAQLQKLKDQEQAIKKLQTELEKLKEIDLENKRRKN